MAGGGSSQRLRAIRRNRNTKVLCGCGCNKRLSSAQSARHMRGLAPIFIAITSASRRNAELSYVRTGLVSDASMAPAFLSESNTPINHGFDNRGNICADEMNIDDSRIDDGLGGSQDDFPDRRAFADPPATQYQQQPGATTTLNATIPRSLSAEDATEFLSSESENSSEGDQDEEDGDDDDDNAYNWSTVNEEMINNVSGLSAEQLLGEDFEREAANNENRITDEDLKILRAFQFKLTHFLSLNAFKALPLVFPQVQLPSTDRIRSRIQFLSGLKPAVYDCCVNSCCCFLGTYQNDKSCRFCGESRYTENGNTARKKYSYSPLIPRLRGLFENKAMCKEILYRHEYVSSPVSNNRSQDPDGAVTMTDIWDGKIYKELRERNIKIGDTELNAKYFSDPHDLALGLTTDGFAPWRRRKYTAWPLLIIIYNLPPEKRFHQKNILALSVIPGPKKPKDIDSFLYPLVEELLELANGVRAFDSNTGQVFCLRAFLIIGFGDIPAISLLIKMKGHNGIAPCRCCNIKGLRIPGSDAEKNKVHYVPLDRSSHPKAGHILRYDPCRLPMRTNEEFRQNAELVVSAGTRAEEEKLAKLYGIKGKTILTSLDSLSFPHSFPYDFMHLIYENLLKNLILLWTNEFKDLSVGTGNYVLSRTVWDAIGDATGKSSDTIPSTYCARLGSIARDRSTFTADNYAFWALYIGPVLLQHKFSNSRYYEHFVELIRLLHICLKYEYTQADIRMIRDGFVDWVLNYEILYYQHSPTRLSACPLTIHALLHIADGIEASGPVWAYWAFPMERYCALLQRAVFNSRRHPYATLDKFVAETAMLSQLKIRYNLFSELSLTRQENENYGFRALSYPTCSLLPPRSLERLPSTVLDRISAALATRYNVRKNIAKRHLPLRIEQWGKVRRIDSDVGDTMKAALLGKAHLDRRDATHIRYQTLVDLHARNRRQLPEYRTATFYGQLLRIFCFTVAASMEINLPHAEILILAEIQPCKTISKHAVLDIQYYKAYGTPLVFDITCIQSLVGRVRLDNSNGGVEWAIIDRSGSLAQAYYAEDEEENGLDF